MGEWAEYFEDFPEENPANYDGRGHYDPQGLLRQDAAKQAVGHARLDEALKAKGQFAPKR